MTTSQSRNQTTEPLSTEAEFAKIAEQTPVLEKANILSQTTKTTNRFAQVLGLAGALSLGTPAFATPSPYEPLADASGKTMLVVNEKVVNNELFAAFEKNGTPEEKETFNKLTHENQKKVHNFYQIGKGEQPDTVKLLKGVYNLMYAYANIAIAQRAFVEYNKTGRMPSAQPLGLKSFMRHIK